MRQSRKYTAAYGISWLWILILMLPHSLAISLTYNTELLKTANVYAVLPNTSWRTASIYIMLVRAPNDTHAGCITVIPNRLRVVDFVHRLLRTSGAGLENLKPETISQIGAERTREKFLLSKSFLSHSLT